MSTDIKDLINQLQELSDLELDEIKRQFWGRAPGHRDYDVITIPLDTATTDHEWVGEGYFVFAWTDGSLDGITMRPNSKEHGAIPLERMGFESSVGFDRLWLSWSAQTGKTLYLFVGRRKGTRISEVNVNATGEGGSGGGENRAAWSHGHKTVSAAGTAEVMPTLIIPNGKSILIRPLNANTGKIYLGNTKANAESSSARVELDFGESIAKAITNLNLVWIDAEVSGEGVWYAVET